ncbi:hypothetical protein PM082_009629 [Marasmius tenuissimus]|nr:hypothetical protein PM082_009629 [Marasmius tenuissimus]
MGIGAKGLPVYRLRWAVFIERGVRELAETPTLVDEASLSHPNLAKLAPASAPSLFPLPLRPFAAISHTLGFAASQKKFPSLILLDLARKSIKMALFHSLRSGRVYGIINLQKLKLPDPFIRLFREAEEREPEMSVEEDLGPKAPSSVLEGRGQQGKRRRGGETKEKGNNSKRREKRRAQPKEKRSLSERIKLKLQKFAKFLSVPFDAADFAAAKSGYTGCLKKKAGKEKKAAGKGALKEDVMKKNPPKKKNPSKTTSPEIAAENPTIEEMKKNGYRHIKWDGVTPLLIVDSAGRIIAVLCGRPDDPTYVKACLDAFDAILEEGDIVGIRNDSPNGPHHHGNSSAFNVGIAMGMGNATPVQLKNGKMAPALARLLAHEGIQRVAGFQNKSYALWRPHAYERHESTLKKVLNKLPNLKANFKHGVFSAATFNFGRSVTTTPHRDFFNWPPGLCFITALGRFDHRKGGQIVLDELKLVIDFPPASTIGLPSAVVTHYNIPVAKGDQRNSFTQYSAGPIFRWVDNDFMTEAQLKEFNRVKYEKMMKGKANAYQENLKIFSTIYELKDFIHVATLDGSPN